MNKRYWKDRAATAKGRAMAAEAKARALSAEAEALRREVEDKRKHWAPIKLTHPWTPRDPACTLCDDPREDPRHV